MIDLNEQAARVHEANKRWWCDPATGDPIKRNKGEMLMLAVSELAESMEGARKDLMDDKIPHRLAEEVEMADCMIRLLDTMNGLGHKVEEKGNVTIEIPDNKGEALLWICYNICMAWRDINRLPEWLNMAIHLIQAYCDEHSLDLWGAFEEKMAYNAVRKDHTNEARLAEGGKKW